MIENTIENKARFFALYLGQTVRYPNVEGEPFIIELMEQMCAESLPPHLYSYWLIIKHQLSINRMGLVEDRQFKSEAIEARNKMTEETFEYLKIMTRGTDADTPDWSDALACCHLD